jgi:hypothetical protein
MDQGPLGGQPGSPAPDDVQASAAGRAEAPPHGQDGGLDAAPESDMAPPPEPRPWDEPPPPIDLPVAPLAVPAGAPPFTVRALLKDAFARYASDFVRLFVLSAAWSALSTVYAVMNLGRGLVAASPGPLESIVVVAIGMVVSSAQLALIAGGRGGSIREAFAIGFRRAFRVFLALVATGLAVVAVVAVIALPASLLLGGLPPLRFGALVVAGLLGIWVGVRLYLAMPGVVADGLGAADALSLSWRVMRPTGVWLRFVGAALLLGLMLGVSSFAFSIVAILAASVESLLAFSALEAAILGPLFLALVVSAYRRLVPERGVDWESDPLAPPFVAPVFGRGAKLILVAIVIAGVTGLASIPFAVKAAFDAGLRSLPGTAASADVVPPGKILFGDSANPATCEVHGQRSTFTVAEGFAWVATLATPATPNDAVALRVTKDAEVLGTVAETSGFFICIGSPGRDIGLPAGTFLIELLINGSVRAAGSVTLR